LSCREIEGCKILSKLTGKYIPLVLDPIFLTSQDIWNKLAVAPDEKEEYIFVYCLKDTPSALKIAQKIKKTSGVKRILLLTPNDLRFYLGCKQIYSSGPQEFIGLIKNARFIVTDSFHGTAFSVLFNKEFYTFISRPNYSSRIISLLSTLSLMDRIVNPLCNIKLMPLDNQYHKLLLNMTEKSYCYLISACNFNEN
jgi:hypothetical protein